MQRWLALFLSFFVLLAAALPATAAEPQNAATLLPGYWEEYSPSSNLVLFTADGTVKILLKKDEIGDLRTLDGKWKMLNADTINLEFSLLDRPFLSTNAKVSFRAGEMILTDKQGQETKHRRHTGKIPQQYVW